MSLVVSHISTPSRIYSASNYIRGNRTISTHLILPHPLKMSSHPYFVFSPKSSASVPLLFSSSAFNSETCRMKARITMSCSNSTSYNIKDYVLEKVSSVNRALGEAVLLREPLILHESMRHSLLAAGRKRVWAVLCIAACELVGGEEATVMPVACAVEMIHTGFSILADLPSMNNNILSWGKPSNHEIFGEEVAILAANALLAGAFEHVVAARKGVASDRTVRLVAELAQCMGSEGLAYEHLIRVEKSEYLGMEPSNECVNGQLQKPAALFEGSLVLGVIVGGAGDQQVSRLRDFARCIGLSLFQAADVIKSGEKETVADNATAYSELIGTEEYKFAENLKMDAHHEQLSGFDLNKAAQLIALANYLSSQDC